MTNRDQYTPRPATGAQVRKDGEDWTLVLVRELRHPRERVWQALTDPAHLREWARFQTDESPAVKHTTAGAPATRALVDRLEDYLNRRKRARVWSPYA